jgi:hypothetical protein
VHWSPDTGENKVSIKADILYMFAKYIVVNDSEFDETMIKLGQNNKKVAFSTLD